MNRFVKQCSRALNGVHDIEFFVILLEIDVKLFNDVESLFLYNNLIKHHGTSPHAPTRGKFTVKLRNL